MCFYDLLTYEIIPQETPNVIRNCSKCKRDTEFYCSEKFRVNANQKMVDVWVVYNCIHCEGTWNYPIFSRVHVNKINSNLYQKFMNNDRETVWYYAFQFNHLRKLCNEVSTNIRYELREKRLETNSNNLTIKFYCKYDFDLRIDKVLAEILGVSRSTLKKLELEGILMLNPKISMKKKIFDNLQITLVGKGLDFNVFHY
ncbi:DUF1062 domain-containing protein [Filobacillus milosensis]|uniref:DUF1062 domain-containing protein n=1 Tax=Filobacillus milosensis TaxID=94137 RepID=A0A4Y8IER0_9BACI|nr:DUF1062 domain-containing protein [Filobacillus milosensis]TFB15030.1 DUF1062 domain-containing protein [Filobacillus milosensis]